ncbi:MAG: hypothetical protein HYX85_00245 [Chloroflexi bacterium]|nr:hypothetical protein [Chloroflexota bacterium]
MRRFILPAIVLLAVAAIFFWGVPEGLAIDTPAVTLKVPNVRNEQEGGPTVVKVGVYVLNIGKLDTLTGAFTIDFYLSFSSDEASNPGSFEFSNGRATSVDKSVDDPAEKFYRIQASLADSLDLSRYPFDRHSLTIQLEDKEQTIRTQVYEASLADSGLDPAVSIAGWELDRWKAEVKEHYYVPYDTTFSRYVFSINVHRSVLAAVLKTILPAIVIVIVGLLSLVLTPDKIVPRLTLNTGSLVGAVLFHLNMTSSLPPLGYLTFADRFMLINYVGLVLTLVSTLIALSHVDKKQNDKADKVHDVALVVVPTIWAALHLFNFLSL